MLSEMASFAACTRESRCTTSRIHQHIEKNSVPLKEVLTTQRQRARSAVIASTTTRSQAKQKVQQRSTSAFVNIAENACGAAISLIHVFDAQRACDVITPHPRCRKARCADPESGVLAIKKFSWISAPTSHRRPPKPNFRTNCSDQFANLCCGGDDRPPSRSTSEAHFRAPNVTPVTRFRPVTGREFRCRACS